MAIFLDERSRVIVQGLTGRVGAAFAGRMVRHYPNPVGGVTPGKGGQEVHGLPVFDTVEQSVRQIGANTSIVVVPAAGLEDAVLEAFAAGITLVWCYTDRVPIHTTMRLVQAARLHGARLVGPNSAGIVSPGKASASELNEDILPLRPGPIGVASKSGSLSYEVVASLYRRTGLGQSTVVCVGGDPVLGTTLGDCVRAFESDPETEIVVLLGEIGGMDEIEIAAFVRTMTKPLFAYVAGRSAPPGKKMGHAGALVNRAQDRAEAKMAALEAAGAFVAQTFDELPSLVARELGIPAPGRPRPADLDQGRRSARQWNAERFAEGLG